MLQFVVTELVFLLWLLLSVTTKFFKQKKQVVQTKKFFHKHHYDYFIDSMNNIFIFVNESIANFKS